MKKIIIIFSCLLTVMSMPAQKTEQIKNLDRNHNLGSAMLAGNLEAQWHQLEGKMSQVAAQSGQVWALGAQAVGSSMERRNFEVFYLTDNNTWQPMNAKGRKITVAKNGEPWLVNANNEIFRGVFTPAANGNKASVSWQKIPGYARDIDACWDGIHIITTNKIEGLPDYQIAFLNNRDMTWTNLPTGGGVGIVTDNRFQPWVINSKGEVYQHKNGEWKMRFEKVQDVDIDVEGNVYIVNGLRNESTYGYPVLTGTVDDQAAEWKPVSGEARSIAADQSRVFCINNRNEVFVRYYRSPAATGPKELMVDKAFIYNLCPKGNSNADFNGAPEMKLGTDLEIARDGSRVYIKVYVSFSRLVTTRHNDKIRLIGSGTWLVPVGELAPKGMKYVKAEYKDYNNQHADFTIQLKNTGFNEINNGCDGREETVDVSREKVYRDRNGRTTSVVDEVRVIGDTGGNDVSTDDDCNCDARVISIRMKPISLTLASR